MYKTTPLELANNSKLSNTDKVIKFFNQTINFNYQKHWNKLSEFCPNNNDLENAHLVDIDHIQDIVSGYSFQERGKLFSGLQNTIEGLELRMYNLPCMYDEEDLASEAEYESLDIILTNTRYLLNEIDWHLTATDSMMANLSKQLDTTFKLLNY